VLVDDAIARQVREMVRMDVLHVGLSREFEGLEKALQDAAKAAEAPAGGAAPGEQARKALDQARERIIALRQRYETLDRLAGDALRRGDKSLDDLNRQVRALQGDMLEVRRIVVSQMLFTARLLLEEARLLDEERAKKVRAQVEEMVRRAVALTPEDRARIEQMFPEFATPPAEGGGPAGPGAAPPKEGR
jgi:small-conductance mechanosensitive channel